MVFLSKARVTLGQDHGRASNRLAVYLSLIWFSQVHGLVRVEFFRLPDFYRSAVERL